MMKNRTNQRNMFKKWGSNPSKTEGQITQKKLNLQGKQLFSYTEHKALDQNKKLTKR